MTLNECIVENAALEWFGELGYAIGHGPHIAPGEPAATGDSSSLHGRIVSIATLKIAELTVGLQGFGAE